MPNPVKYGSEISAVLSGLEGQYDPAIRKLTTGKFVVAWTDDTNYSGLGFTQSSDIHLQIYNANGTRSGSIIVANTSLANRQYDPAVTYLNNGGFVVAWSDGGSTGGSTTDSVKAQIFSATGSKVGSVFQISTLTAGYQNTPSLMTLSDGRFVAVWDDDTLRGQIYNANGTKSGSQFLVTSVALNGHAADITALSSGKFAVSWTAYDDDGFYESRVQLFSSTGTKIGALIEVAGSPLNSADAPAITTLSGGNFAVVGNVSEDDIVLKIYNSSGALIHTNLQVNTGQIDDIVRDVDMKKLKDGRIVVAWQETSDVPGDPNERREEIHIRILNADGSTNSSDIIVKSSTDDLSEPNLAVLVDGRFVVNWRYDDFTGNKSAEVRSQIYDPRLAAIDLTGTSGDDTFVGSAFGDTLRGEAGNDRIEGKLGNDNLSGGTGADRFYFNTTLNSSTNVDKISTLGSSDVIVLDDDIFTAIGSSLTSTEFKAINTGTGFSSVDSTDHIIFVKSTGKIYYDADGSSTGHARVLFAEIQVGATVSYADFDVVA